MAFAYHMEALRRQRMFDRKHAALAKIAIFEAEQGREKRYREDRNKQIKEEQEETKAKERELYLKSMGRTGKNRQGMVNSNYTHMLEEQKKHISQKDLRHQEKVLRDHCLTMGRVNEHFLA